MTFELKRSCLLSKPVSQSQCSLVKIFSRFLTTMSSKRNSYRSLTLDEKVKIIREVEKGGKKKSEIATEYGIPASTLSTFLKDKAKILQGHESSVPNTRKRMRDADFPEIDRCVIKWFKQARDQNVPVSGFLIRAKAEEFGKKLNYGNFKASTGWFSGFKERNDLCFRKICGEDASVCETGCSSWLEKLPQILEGYAARDIFNVDETGLFFKCMPDTTFLCKGDSCSGGKRSKERVTILVGANMDGSEKFPLLMIGKSAKPRCFAKIKSLPVKYAANRKAWMTGELFENWIRAQDRNFFSQKRKILLFIDNCTAHNSLPVMKAIKVVYFPPNMTSRLQPMDQGVIKNLKHFYRRYVVAKILDEIEKSSENKIPINLLDASRMISRAWGEVSTSTISNCFKKAGFCFSNDDFGVVGPAKQDDEWNVLSENEHARTIDFNAFVDCDANLAVCGQITDAEIIQEETMKNCEEEEESDDDIISEDVKVPTIAETSNAIDIIRRFTESQENVDGVIFGSLDTLENFMMSNKLNQKQRKMTYFFNKT